MGDKKISNIIIWCLIALIVIVLLMIFDVIPNPSSNRPNKISFTENNIRLEKYNSVQLSLTEPNKNVRFKSSDSSIASVNEMTGYVTGVNVGTVTITAYIDGKSDIYDECIIEVYTKAIEVNNIELSEKNINLYVGKSKQLNTIITPSNATNKNVFWETSNSNIVTVDNNGLVVANNIGTATISVRTENGKSDSCTITVTVELATKPQIEKLIVSSGKLSIKVDETKKIEYRVEPPDGEIRRIKWMSSDPTVAEVDGYGNVTGKKEGGSVVTLVINDNLRANITVTVTPKLKGINLKSSGVLKLKVGETSQIKAETIPADSGIKLVYKSNNNNVTVSDTGLVKAVSAGNSLVTIYAGDYTRSVNITITKKTTTPPPGPGTPIYIGGVWGYTDSRTVSPTRAGSSFFQGLVDKGIGTLSGNVYSYAGYSYYIKTSNLVYNGRSSLVRIYYPPSVDLSNVNTFTFLGGSGELNMGGFFASVDSNTSLIKSGGIIILVSATGSYHYQDAINATNFVKAITKQNSGRKNSVGGYSLGGPAAGSAMVNGNYNRLLLFNTRVELSQTSRLKNKAIYVYSPTGDKLQDSTRTTLTALKNDGAGKNVTLITNDSSMINTFGSYFTIINPGSAQGSGHGWRTFTEGYAFAFACKD